MQQSLSQARNREKEERRKVENTEVGKSEREKTASSTPSTSPPPSQEQQQPFQEPTTPFPDFETWTQQQERARETVPWAPSRFKRRKDKHMYECQSKDTSKTCSWEMGNRFFKFESVAPQISDKEMSEMTFLLVDHHGGPLLDTKHTLTAIGADPQKVFSLCSLKVHCKDHDSSPEYKRANKFFEIFTMHYFDRMEEERARLAQLNLTKVDVVICLYPGHQCTLAHELGRFVIIRFMLRWQQYNQHSHAKWGEWLRKLHECGNGAVAVSTAYDWMAVKHYLGIDAIPWPSIAVQSTPAEPAKAQGLVFSQLQPYTSHSYSGMFYTKYLFAAARGGELFDVFHLHWIGVNRAKLYPAVYTVTYGPQVTKFVEFYFSGLPVIAPNHTVLTEWHLRYGYVFHRGYDLQADNPGYKWIYQNFPESAWSPCCGTEPEHRTNASTWLWFVDHLQWPDVFLTGSPDDIRDAYLLMNNTAKRAAHVDKVMKWKAALLGRLSGILRSQLKDFKTNFEKGDFCERVKYDA